MKLLEYEAKKIVQEYGILVPQGNVVTTVSEAESLASNIGRPVVLKAQIAVSGRGKAGGILFADGPERAGEVARSLLGSTIKESLVCSLLVEEQLDITEQYYLSIAVDGSVKSYVVLFSSEGGVDIEQVARYELIVIVDIALCVADGRLAVGLRRLAAAVPVDHSADVD